ncbi:hypothetical protein LVJ82_13520 [Vitreoscilla massiliensis]|uniref:N-linked glycosylation glycosyltransferase PglG n=1 Tax=Vitreoscilla massiliensis TaxID=1689272 RepID=A0ABY4DY85_9NEIS|nr:hypothetical protein [Vitreoscilla massiliensis]UOO88479.1 hypothetical protein LVJ82_13520 [Vitreoscilla massiliensis]
MPKFIHHVYMLVHAVIALMFLLAALLLVYLAAQTGLKVWGETALGSAVVYVVEALGILAAAIVSVQISQTILEEEIIRDVHISGPSRIRRFLSRFLVMLVVALTIEGLIASFKAQKEPQQLLYAAALLVATALLLAGWGVFVKLNSAAEELEPESLAEAKKEDTQVTAK